MKMLTCALALIALMGFPHFAEAQQARFRVVTTCGSGAMGPLGSDSTPTQDVNGEICTTGGGGGGGGADPNNAPFSGITPMTVGSAVASARSVYANCTVAGTATFVFLDASTATVSVQVGYQSFPFAVTQVSAQTATCNYGNLK